MSSWFYEIPCLRAPPWGGALAVKRELDLCTWFLEDEIGEGESAYLENHGCSRIARSAAGPQAIPSAEHS